MNGLRVEMNSFLLLGICSGLFKIRESREYSLIFFASICVIRGKKSESALSLPKGCLDFAQASIISFDSKEADAKYPGG